MCERSRRLLSREPEETQKYGAGSIFAAEQVGPEADEAASDAELSAARADAGALLGDVFGGAGDRRHALPTVLDGALFAPIAGYPEVTLPAGYAASGRHPYGVVLLGDRFADADRCSVAYAALEQSLPERSAPSVINPTMWRCLGDGDDASAHCLA